MGCCVCVCVFLDQFRRRDTSQTGNANFNYDDVSSQKVFILCYVHVYLCVVMYV